VIRDWLQEADRISYEEGGTISAVLTQAFLNLEAKEADGDRAS